MLSSAFAIAVAVEFVALKTSSEFLFALRFCAALANLLCSVGVFQLSIVLILMIWWKIVRVSERKFSCISSSGLTSARLTALRIEFASSSELALVMILAPIIRMVSCGRPRFSIKSLMSMYSLERCNFQRKRVIHFSEGNEGSCGLPNKERTKVIKYLQGFKKYIRAAIKR